MSGKKRLQKFDTENICKRVIFYIYTVAMFGLYPLTVDDAYFNITVTKTNFFCGASIAFVVCYILAAIADYLINKENIITKVDVTSDDSFILKPDFWMQLFLLSNVVAWYQSYSPKSAFYGDNARYMGLMIYIVIAVMFIALSTGVNLRPWLLMVYAASTCFVYIIGLIQHMELDIKLWESGKKFFVDFEFLHYRERLGEKQINIYMSTLGNINIFSSFIVISMSMFLGVFIFSSKKYLKRLSAVIICLSGALLMIANSDSGYLGAVGVMFFLLLLAYNESRVRDYFMSVILVAVGNLVVVFLNKFVVDQYDKRGGVAESLDNIGLAIGILVVTVGIYFIVRFVENRYSHVLAKINKKAATIIFSVISMIMALLCVIIGNSRGMAIFTFNDKWGTYRGFVWSRGWEIFTDAPMVNKLFGYGNESFGDYMKAYYYEDMVEITKKVYDNAHNELLQYLITIGIFGVITYLGLCIVSSLYILKHGKNNSIAYGCVASIVGYFVQSIVNINQPITTPLYFFIMAVGVGYATYLRKKDGENDKVIS